MPTEPITPLPSPLNSFPAYPPRDDMQNALYLHSPGYLPALIRYLGAPDTTIVISEAPIGWTTGQREGLLVPDLLIAFDIDRDALLAQRGYAIEYQGKPPDFVLEIASHTTGQRDDTSKRTGYATYGVPEYWRFDPTGGEYHQAHLAGDRLIDGLYHPIPITRSNSDRHWGHSGVLALDLCWEYGRLRWYDPAAQRYLLTHDDEAEGRLAAESECAAERTARLAAESERAAERTARLAAESERIAERAARLTAESERTAERTARFAAEEEARRLREQLDRLRSE